MTSETLAARLKREYGAKAIKYVSVSVVNVFFGQGLLFFFSKVVELTFVEANIAAVSISAIPAFILSRRWIWQLKTRSHFMREVVPFWSIALLGLLLSTVMVAVAQQFSEATWVLMLTNLMAFGLLWVGKFFFLDKVLFGAHHHEFDENLEAEVAELEATRLAELEASRMAEHAAAPPVDRAAQATEPHENVGEATA